MKIIRLFVVCAISPFYVKCLKTNCFFMINKISSALYEISKIYVVLSTAIKEAIDKK